MSITLNLDRYLKKLILKMFLLIIFFITFISLEAAEVMIDNNSSTTYGAGEFNICVSGYNINVVRLAGENVNYIIPERIEGGSKIRKDGVTKTWTFKTSKINLPSNVSLTPISVTIKHPAETSYKKFTIVGNDVYINNIFSDRKTNGFIAPYVSRRLIIQPSVPDGRYAYVSNVHIMSPHYLVNLKKFLTIKTVPTITAGNIEFGELVFGSGGGIVTKTGNINLNGGTPNANIRLVLNTSTVNLKKIGSESTIPVSLSLSQLTQLNSAGGGQATLEARVNTARTVESGEYRGEVVVSVNYN